MRGMTFGPLDIAEPVIGRAFCASRRLIRATLAGAGVSRSAQPSLYRLPRHGAKLSVA